MKSLFSRKIKKQVIYHPSYHRDMMKKLERVRIAEKRWWKSHGE